MYKNLKEVAEVVSKQGHSGFSHGYFMGQLNKILNFKPLGKITFNDEDFGEDFDGVRQHKLDGRYFLHGDGNVSFTEDCYFNEYKILRSDFEYDLCEDYKNKFSGGGYKLVVGESGVKVLAFGGILKNVDDYYKHDEAIPINTVSIEIPRDWWIQVIDEKDIQEYLKYYDVDECDLDDYIKKEVLDFEDGKHAIDIAMGINKVIKDLGYHHEIIL